MEDKYVTGKGMFGGIKGSYGRYSVGPYTMSLSSQFKDIDKYEEAQRRRFGRKKESGYTGAGFWFGMYPTMTNNMSMGTDPRPEQEPKELNNSGQTASATDTMGMGGVTFNGAAGVS